MTAPLPDLVRPSPAGAGGAAPAPEVVGAGPGPATLSGGYSAVPSASRRVLVAAPAPPAAFLRGVADYARTHRWQLRLDAMPAAGPTGNCWCHGVLAVAPYPAASPASAADPDIPRVTLSEEVESAVPGAPFIGINHREIGRVAATHLLDRFHRHFAWAPLRDDAANRQRLDGFLQCLSLQGCACTTLPPAYRQDGSLWLDQRTARHPDLIAILRRLPRPLAVFAFDDHVALDLLDACADAGLSVPEDVAVLGVGDTLACTAARVPLSTVELDFEATGYRAAALLDGLMSGHRPVETVRLGPTGVATRLSTDVLAVPDQRVARALHFIATNYANPMLSVAAVADACGTSRRQLERSVRRETGCTVNAHIMRCRMKEASRLLKNQPRTRSDDVAARVGLAGRGTFFRTFRRFYGTSPKRIVAVPQPANCSG